ncbi:hypothetical protein HpBGD53_18730 [Helicobacter pylori]
MQNGYYAATGAMATQFNRLDLTSNNLANLNTNGFKRDDAITGDFLRLYQQYREQLPLEDQTLSLKHTKRSRRTQQWRPRGAP